MNDLCLHLPPYTLYACGWGSVNVCVQLPWRMKQWYSATLIKMPVWPNRVREGAGGCPWFFPSPFNPIHTLTKLSHLCTHTQLPQHSLYRRPRPDELCCLFCVPTSVSLLLSLSLSPPQYKTRWKACQRELMGLLDALYRCCDSNILK